MKGEYSFNGSLIFEEESRKILLKKISASHVPNHGYIRRMDIWFEINGIIYWGVQYGTFAKIVHIKATKRKLMEFEK